MQIDPPKIVLKDYQGSCHCGSVEFNVKAPINMLVIRCTCTLCYKKNCEHFIVPRASFKVLRGEQELTAYNAGKEHDNAMHNFCRKCGVEIYFTPKAGLYTALNFRTIDAKKVLSVNYYENFGAQDWQEFITRAEWLVYIKKFN